MTESVGDWWKNLEARLGKLGIAREDIPFLCISRAARLLGKPLEFDVASIERVNQGKDERDRFDPQYCEPGGACNNFGNYNGSRRICPFLKSFLDISGWGIMYHSEKIVVSQAA